MSSVKPSGIVTLLSDYGRVDPYVGMVHGALLDKFRKVVITDLTHDIQARDVAAAALWLAASYPAFPEGTVHVGLVRGSSATPELSDAPVAGVAMLAVEADRHVFLAPDNGLLGVVLSRAKGAEVRKVNLSRLGVPKGRRTFAGRDRFAPVAAELASGRRWLSELGPIVEPVAPSAVRGAEVVDGGIAGTVIIVDGMGNLVTNLRAAVLGRFDRPELKVAGRRIPLLTSYAEAEPGALLGLVNASDQIEIAAREASAHQILGVVPAEVVQIVESEAGAGQIP